MNITKASNGGEIKLSITGRIDTVTSNQLSEEIDKTFQEGLEKLILDFSGVEYISSAGLRIIISTQKRISADNLKMEISNMNASVKNIFDITGFSKILTIV